jgi:hypothetical protein
MRLPTASNKARSGTHAIECAVVYPFTFAIILATIVGGLGIYRYQQMAFLSREVSRYCATHGAAYIKENQNSSHPTSPTAGALSIAGGTLPGTSNAGVYYIDTNYIINNVVKPQAAILDTTNLNNGGPMNVSITFNSPGNSTWPTTWDSASQTSANYPLSQTVISGNAANVTNTVSVLISYQWTPEVIVFNLAGPITLQSKSVMPMSY